MEKTMYQDLIKAQQAFGPALKSSTNPHFKSRYADLAACVEAVQEPLNKNNFYLAWKNHPSDRGVAVECLFIHSSGESISSGVIELPVSKNDAQGFGSAMTYARRYALMTVTGIAPEDDDGNAASRSPGVDHSKIDDMVKKIKDCASLDSLKKAYTEAMRTAGSDADAIKRIADAKDEMKKIIEQADKVASE